MHALRTIAPGGGRVHTQALRNARRLPFYLRLPPTQRVPSSVFTILCVGSPVVDDGVPSGLVDRPLEARHDVGLGGAQLQPLPEGAAALATGRASRLRGWKVRRSAENKRRTPRSFVRPLYLPRLRYADMFCGGGVVVGERKKQ